ncbi:polyamine transporter tpo5 [Rhodosporidiobolus nylandii]
MDRQTTKGSFSKAERPADVRVAAPSIVEDSGEDARLAALGVKSEFAREFTNISTISFAFSIMGVASSLSTTIDTPLLSGGPASVVWCWFIGCFMCMCLGLSIAEIISAYPTNGGLYSSSAFLVPLKYRAKVGWTVGWLNLLGQVAGVASTEFGLAGMILAAASISTDGAYVATAGHTVAVFVGLLVIHGLLNGFVFVNLGTVIAIVIALAATYYDATAHISEEIKEASIRAPVAVVVAVLGTGIFGFVLNILYVLCSGPLDDLPGAAGYSAATIILRNVGKKGFYVLWTGVCLTAFFVVSTAMQACARTFHAFSRDDGLPDRRFFCKSPINGVWLVAIFSAILGLLDFASYTAVNAVFSLCAIALDTSYIIPIFLKLVFRDHPEVRYTPGPFSLGTGFIGYAVPIIAISWTSFVVVILALPESMPVSATEMNYSGPILLAVILLSWIWWFLGGRKHYSGPRSHTEIEESDSHSKESAGVAV